MDRTVEGAYLMKNFEQYKRIVRFTSVISLIFCEMVIYWAVWLKHYNIEM